jgi:hypothetical protein
MRRRCETALPRHFEQDLAILSQIDAAGKRTSDHGLVLAFLRASAITVNGEVWDKAVNSERLGERQLRPEAVISDKGWPSPRATRTVGTLRLKRKYGHCPAGPSQTRVFWDSTAD